MLNSSTTQQPSTQTNYSQYGRKGLELVFSMAGFMLMNSVGVFWPVGA